MNNFSKEITDDLKVEEIKRKLASFISEGRVDQSVIHLLVNGKSCVPLECELLDYKQELQDNKTAKAKAVVSIVSMYNTYGGYILYGVAEKQSETEFEVVGINKNSIDVESLKALTKEYTGERIQLSLQYFPAEDVSSNNATPQVGLLYIPKRISSEPLCFGKRGPEDNKKKPVFVEEDIYYRKGDECLLAKGLAVLTLAGPRPCPYDDSRSPIDQLKPTKSGIHNNLPDRNFICARFIGRKYQIEELWAWFADEFSHVRVLAGEGGLGKTSIAYQFAEVLCKEVDSGIENIIWLTAKKEQFSGYENKSIEMPETHFNSYHDLLIELCSELGYMAAELEGASEKLLKKYIQEGAKVTTSLIVVDDVDSLPVEEQRKVLEIGFLFGGTNSRLLLTTRINLGYSSDIAIQVKGFDLDDYRPYIKTLQERHRHIVLTEPQIKLIHEVTGGSPLFTESLYRLMRFSNFGNAISEWRGHFGEDARAAALSREVDQLNPEAKRVLLASAYLNECSLVELTQVTGYSENVLRDCLTSLTSLYLLSAPQITSEPRFKIGFNTKQFVLNSKVGIASDFKKIEQRVKDLRSQTKTLKGKRDDPIVGAAINQAMAQLRQNDIERALETIAVAEKQCGDSADLVTMKARCLLKKIPPDPDEARKLAKKAFNSGSRKEVLFDIWYDAEWDAKHYVGAYEAASNSIENKVGITTEWLVKRAAAQWHVAKDQEKAGNFDRAIRDYWTCANDLLQAQQDASPDDLNELRRQRFQIHDSIWLIFNNLSERNVDAATKAIDELKKMVRAGDNRISICLRLIEPLNWLLKVVSGKNDEVNQGLLNIIDQRVREVRTEIERYAQNNKGDTRITHVFELWEKASNETKRGRKRNGDGA